MPGPFYFAWVGPGATTFGAEHHVYDEQIFAISIQHTEGDIPSLRLDIRNTGSVGLLAAGRNQWCWLSWDDGSSIVPIFHGRLIGIPQNLHLEVVTLEFTARPLGFDALKAALADTLRVSPYWDPIWIAQDQDTPDTVLEARSALYHVDRVSNAVTICFGFVSSAFGSVMVRIPSLYAASILSCFTRVGSVNDLWNDP